MIRHVVETANRLTLLIPEKQKHEARQHVNQSNIVKMHWILYQKHVCIRTAHPTLYLETIEILALD